MSTLNKWLMLMGALGAGYLVVANPNGFAKAAGALGKLVGGTETQIITGGAKGGQ